MKIGRQNRGLASVNLFVVGLTLASCVGSTDGATSSNTNDGSLSTSEASTPAQDGSVLQRDAAVARPDGDSSSPDASPADGMSSLPDASDVTAPSDAWVDATGNLAGMDAQCGTLTLVASHPRTKAIYAGVAGRGLWTSENSGQSWTKLGTGAGSAEIKHRPAMIHFDPLNANVFWLVGIYSGAGVFRTDDAGQSFKTLGSVSHNDTLSIDFNDPSRSTMIVGGHEQEKAVFMSTNKGESWQSIGANFPGTGHCTSVQLVDSSTFLVGCGRNGGGGIYRSTNAGQSWTKVSNETVSPTPLQTSSGDVYWPKLKRGLMRSTDRGETFSESANANESYGRHIIELPDGRVATAGKDSLFVTDDGVTWNALGTQLPFEPEGLSYSYANKTFYIWRATCGFPSVPVGDRSIMSAGFDWQDSK